MRIRPPSIVLVALLSFGASVANAQNVEQCGPAAQHFEKSLGMELTYGCYVNMVNEGSLAEKEGLKPRDLLVSLNEKKFRDFQSALDFALNVKAEAADTRAHLEVLKYIPSTGTYEATPSVVTFRINTNQLKQAKPIGFRCAPTAMILKVNEGTPASMAGITAGHFIHSINGTRLADMDNAIKIDLAMREAVKSCKVNIELGLWGEESTLPNGNHERALSLVPVTIDLSGSNAGN